MITISQEKCNVCGLCVQDCVTHALTANDDHIGINNALCFECSHCLAICPTAAITLVNYDPLEIIPYERNSFDINHGNLQNFIKFRRSIRSYTNKPVSPEVIAELIEAARYSPTAGNQQPLRYIVADNPDAVAELTKTAINALEKLINDHEGSKTLAQKNSGVDYLAGVKRICANYLNHGIDGLFYSAPAIIAVAGPLTAILDAGIASASIALLSNAMGLGNCFIGFFSAAVDADVRLRDYIGLKSHERILSTLAIGYPTYKYQRTVNRKPAKVTRL